MSTPPPATPRETNQPVAEPPAKAGGRRDLWTENGTRLAILTYAVTFAIFAPLLQWIFLQSYAQEQLHLAFLILAGAGIWLYIENRERLHLNLHFGGQSQALLLGAYACFLGAFTSNLLFPASDRPEAPWLGATYVALNLAALSLALGSLVAFLFGSRALRASRGILFGFFFYVGLVAVLPIYDWPLRRVAGEWSLWLLQILGIDARLGTVALEEPILVLEVSGQVFNVAQECNGFGLLSASILLTLLLSIYRKISLLDRAILMTLAVVGALFFNAVRILGIVLLAPQLPQSRYLLMHDTVGILIFYGALGLLWWFIRGFGSDISAPNDTASAKA
ncbi:MAG: archaeosortase/exosortase family protein [Opitutales bacterium]